MTQEFPLPFGYKREGSKIAIDEEQAKIIRKKAEQFKLFNEILENPEKFDKDGLFKEDISEISNYEKAVILFEEYLKDSKES
ncbi:hypothetical protein OZL92_16510 [Bacillus sonorensis]|uniref:Uncharacterized protein n=1 Tax=Bacillus sonorensis L12 TaxID=1274524 RepID=M5NXE2_9BACI|nr:MULTISPECIES: hypothetical protein [Bacillus]EME72546.1 hypothetical protein BSONL12_21609 [Bacillus sonorensis L12]MCZ0075322.1 hypothetical protein [Bacillus sonorensis]MCZ0092950.1 hypothetical protein [Bacillus sonorensis]NWN80029.1 hypothetical protein [Bacillus sp. (in: firmicutes)]PAD57860.1 hypothetical protein CHH92_22820 [Bacillus sonorensis]